MIYVEGFRNKINSFLNIQSRLTHPKRSPITSPSSSRLLSDLDFPVYITSGPSCQLKIPSRSKLLEKCLTLRTVDLVKIRVRSLGVTTQPVGEVLWKPWSTMVGRKKTHKWLDELWSTMKYPMHSLSTGTCCIHKTSGISSINVLFIWLSTFCVCARACARVCVCVQNSHLETPGERFTNPSCLIKH